MLFRSFQTHVRGTLILQMGKNYNYANMYKAYAMRGYNLFTHPNVQAYGFRFMRAQMQPFGHYVTLYDTLGGTGDSLPMGGLRTRSDDIFGIKYAFPNAAEVNFVYRQFLAHPYKDEEGNSKIDYDVVEAKVQPRSGYYNRFLSALIHFSEFEDEGDFETQNKAAMENKLSFFCKDRGLMIVSSGFSNNAMQMQMHVRQDMGGKSTGSCQW